MNKDNIVFSIEGFDQLEAFKMGLDIADLALLRWFITFKDSGSMVTRIINNDKYYWLNYSTASTELPLLRLSKDVIGRRFRNMAAKGVLKNETIRENGTFSYYATGDNYYLLMPVANKEKFKNNHTHPTTQKAEGTTQKTEGLTLKAEGYVSKVRGGTTQKAEGCDSKVRSKTLILNNSNTNNSNTKRLEKNRIDIDNINTNKEREKQINTTPISSIQDKLDKLNNLNKESGFDISKLTKEQVVIYNVVGHVPYLAFLDNAKVLVTNTAIEIQTANTFTANTIAKRYKDKLHKAFNKDITIYSAEKMKLDKLV